MKIRKAEYVISNTDIEKCPTPNIGEVAFIGRSNVGKSSLINMLANSNSLAKISSKPGKTQTINHFTIDDNSWYLVDLPGYGWASVSKTQRAEFRNMIESYFLNRENLMYTFVLIDIRHQPQQVDLDFMEWLGTNEVPFMIVFTKSDKLSKPKLEQSLEDYLSKLGEVWEPLPHYVVTSAVTKVGQREVFENIELGLKAFKK